MESIFGPVPKNPVVIESSIVKENWPRFDVILYVNFTVNFPPVPCILFGVNLKPRDITELFCDHLLSTREHVKNILSRPLTNVFKYPDAVMRNFTNSIQANMGFPPLLFAVIFR